MQPPYHPMKASPNTSPKKQIPSSHSMHLSLAPTLIAALSILAAPLVVATPPTLTIEPKDEHTLAVDDGTTVVNIRSKRGIGRTSIVAKDGVWPKKLVLRLYLKGLENFEISNGTKTLKMSVSSQKNPPPRGEGMVKIVPEKGAKREIPLKGYFEIEVPAELLKAKPEKLKLHWIDFYRG
jgi:hypothetical protein